MMMIMIALLSSSGNEIAALFKNAFLRVAVLLFSSKSISALLLEF